MIKKYIRNEKVANIVEWVVSILAAVVLYVVIRSFVFRLATITGPSMEPTLYHGEHVIITKYSYIFAEPKYGDIIAFPYKENRKQHYIKRVVGLPNDIIDFKENKFIVNGVVQEDNFSNEITQPTGDVKFPYTVPDGCYFVLGDNRNNSKDSRYSSVSSIPKNEIDGKISLRIWPISKIGIIG